MKLIYDMRILQGRMHGMARYGLELLKAMLDRREDFAAGVLVAKPEYAAFLPNDKRLVAIACGLKPYGLGSQMHLPSTLGRIKPELYHCPFYAAPAAYAGPMALTIHDLIHLRFPKDYGLKHRLFYRLFVKKAAAKAKVVFTVSQRSKKDIVALFGLPEEKVVVTSNGVGEAFRPLPEAERLQALAGLGELPERFILGVGNPKPHKNLGALIKAHAALPEVMADGLKRPGLWLVGVDAHFAKAAGAAPDARALGHLDDATLAAAYGQAMASLVPSLYEGFGLPALETLACGGVLIASDRASLPEVAGEAGIITQPTPEGLTGAILRLAEEPGLGDELRAKGPLQAEKFTWKRAAGKTLGVYDDIKAGRR